MIGSDCSSLSYFWMNFKNLSESHVNRLFMFNRRRYKIKRVQLRDISLQAIYDHSMHHVLTTVQPQNWNRPFCTIAQAQGMPPSGTVAPLTILRLGVSDGCFVGLPQARSAIEAVLGPRVVAVASGARPPWFMGTICFAVVFFVSLAVIQFNDGAALNIGRDSFFGAERKSLSFSGNSFGTSAVENAASSARTIHNDEDMAKVNVVFFRWTKNK